MQHTTPLNLSNAHDKAYDIAVSNLRYDPLTDHITDEQTQAFHKLYQQVLGELMTALDPEAF